jgi:hypothetical protein
MFRILYIILFCLIYCYSSGQNPDQISELLNETDEQNIETINSSDLTEIPEELNDLLNNPLNLNTEKADVLVRYNLISASQLKSLEQYKIKMGALIEREELQQVPGFDKQLIRKLLPYITVKTEKIIKTNHQVTLRLHKPSSSNENYKGSPVKILFRYKGPITNKLTINFTGEKDAGEIMMSKGRPAFDFNSASIIYKGSGMIDKIVIGDYTVEYGQGLTAWNGFNFGGSAGITGIVRHGRGIIPYSGTDENRFFRGIGTKLKIKSIRLDCWLSHHKIDANTFYDSLSGNSYVTSFQNSGYHRTYSENLGYHSQNETGAGLALNYSIKNFSSGIVSHFEQFNLPVIKNNQPYALYKFNGTTISNTGWNYIYYYKNIVLFGESTIYNKSLAFLSGVLISLDAKFTLGLIIRHYPQEFINLKSNAFGKNSENSNEKGKYFGINYKIFSFLTFSSCFDLYSFPYLKYQIDAPSIGSDYFHQLDYTPNKKFNVRIRYRKKIKQVSEVKEVNDMFQITDKSYNTLHTSARYKSDAGWDYGLRVDFSKSASDLSGFSTVISQDLIYNPMGEKYSFNIRYAVFYCPEFDNRIYSFENDVTGSFSMPFYYGNGSRYYFNLNYRLTPSIGLSCRYSTTWTDGEEETTNSDLKFQATVKFK